MDPRVKHEDDGGARAIMTEIIKHEDDNPLFLILPLFIDNPDESLGFECNEIFGFINHFHNFGQLFEGNILHCPILIFGI